MHKKRFFKN